jgi:ABC-2 type transport system permease protein
MSGKRLNLRRLRGLLRKEWVQVLRDPSSVAIAFVLPLVLLFLFGYGVYGVSLDAEEVPVAVVIEKPTPETGSFLASMANSRYVAPMPALDRPSAKQAMLAGKVRAIVVLRADFDQRLESHGTAPIQVLLDGVDANTARIVAGYLDGIWANWLVQEQYVDPRAFSLPVEISQRVWFNGEVRSSNFIVPGLIAIIMTLIGALLTALVVAREWERGTMETLLTTPASTAEILLGKLVPYFLLGMGGMALSFALAVGLFDVPYRGSLWMLVLSSSLFLLSTLGMGLVISTLAKNQFVAGQVAMVATYLPAIMLSGFIFDISAMPEWVQAVTYVVSARYFVAILQTLFLAGDVWSVVLPNLAALLVIAGVFLGFALAKTRRRLD